MASKSILGMNRALDLQEQLAEEMWRQMRERDCLRKQFAYAGQVLAMLQQDDPQWEEWFEANITDETSLAQAVALMGARMMELHSRKVSALATVRIGELWQTLRRGCKGDPELYKVLDAVAHGGYMIAAGKPGVK